MASPHLRRKSSLPLLSEFRNQKTSCCSDVVSSPSPTKNYQLPAEYWNERTICEHGASLDTDSSICSHCYSHICLPGSYEKHYHSDSELLNPKLQYAFQRDMEDNNVFFGSSKDSDLGNFSSDLSKQLTCLSDKTLECGATSFQNTVLAIPGRTFNNRGRCRLCFRERCYGCRYFIGYSKVNVSALYTATSVTNVTSSFKSLPDGKESDVIRKSFTGQQKISLFCIGLINLTAFLSMSVIAPFFPQEASAKGMSGSVSGFVFSIYALVVMLASPVIGKMAPHVGVRFIYLSGIFISGASNIIFGVLAYVENETLFMVYCFVVRSFEALGAAAFQTASDIIILETFPDDIGTVFGLVETCVGVGMSIGPAVGGGLYALGGYGLPFYVLGSLVLITFPINWCLLSEIKGKSEKNVKSTYKQLLSIPHVIIFSVVVVVASQAQGFLDPTLEPHFRQFNLSPGIVGLLFLVMAAAYALFSPAVGYVTSKYEVKYPMMITGLSVMTLSLLLLGPSPFIPLDGSILWINILAIVLLGVSLACAFIPTFEAIFDSGIDAGLPDNLGTYSIVSGLWAAMYSLGEVTGPTLGGVLSDSLTFPQAATVMALCSFLTAILITFTWLWPKITCKKMQEDSDSGISDKSDESSETDYLINSTKHSYGSSIKVQRQEKGSV